MGVEVFSDREAEALNRPCMDIDRLGVFGFDAFGAVIGILAVNAAFFVDDFGGGLGRVGMIDLNESKVGGDGAAVEIRGSGGNGFRKFWTST